VKSGEFFSNLVYKTKGSGRMILGSSAKMRQMIPNPKWPKQVLEPTTSKTINQPNIARNAPYHGFVTVVEI